MELPFEILGEIAAVDRTVALLFRAVCKYFGYVDLPTKVVLDFNCLDGLGELYITKNTYDLNLTLGTCVLWSNLHNEILESAWDVEGNVGCEILGWAKYSKQWECDCIMLPQNVVYWIVECFQVKSTKTYHRRLF